nr:ATP-binding protein [uncultured Lichenicoccus sp.]
MSNGSEPVARRPVADATGWVATLRTLGRLLRRGASALMPRSLAARTALVLLTGLGVVQAAGLAIHALDRISLDRAEQQRETGMRVVAIYRSIVETDPGQRDNEVARMRLPSGFKVALTPGPQTADLDPESLQMQHEMRTNLQMMPFPLHLHPSQVMAGANRRQHRFEVSMHLPDESRWVSILFHVPPPNLFSSPTFPIAFTLMIVATGILTNWAVRRLTAPVRTLAAAAEALGRDVNASPLPEDGPLEVRTAAIAFNTMATRIRRFVTDRTLLLTAIGHDLRTPITRLKLRSEFIEDDELRRKFTADLDELEAMVSATLAFGRDSANREPLVPLDLTALLSTILDEAVDGRPDITNQVGFATEPPVVTIKARSLALKRALANLIGNAIVYGGGAMVTLKPAQDFVTVLIEDDGPGLAAGDLERVFEPFVRVEASRNRETGGTGLGLAIARNIIRGHGGDITLANRMPNGLRATVTLLA